MPAKIEPQLFSGVQEVNATNYTHTTREGYAHHWDYENMDELQFNSSISPNEYYNLGIGLHKVSIEGTMYCFMIHEALSGNSKVIIKNPSEAYLYNGLSMKKDHLILYKLHDSHIIDAEGLRMENTINDHLDLFIVDGVTRCLAGNSVSMKYPGELEFFSMLNVDIITKTFRQTFLLNMKKYLKSIDLKPYRRVCDTLYLEAEIRKATFVFRTAKLTLTGFEQLEKVEELSDKNVNVFRYENPLVKPNGLIKCSHLPTISWRNLADKSYINEGIAIAPEGWVKGIYMKVPTGEFPTIDDFIKALKWWDFSTTEKTTDARYKEYYTARAEMARMGFIPDLVNWHSVVVTPMNICYELETPRYKKLTLDDYNIDTYFNHNWIIVYPYRPKSKWIRSKLKDLDAVVPIDGVIKTLEEQQKESPEDIKNTDKNYIIESLDTMPMSMSERESKTYIFNSPYTKALSIPYSTRSDEYKQLLNTENVWRDLVLDCPLKYLDREIIDSTTVAVVPKDQVMKTKLEQFEESGYKSKYDDILDENYILRSLCMGRMMYKSRWPKFVTDTDFVAVVSKDGRMRTKAEQLEESGHFNMYQKILDENYIYRNLIVTGEINVRCMYFYKHLKVA